MSVSSCIPLLIQTFEMVTSLPYTHHGLGVQKSYGLQLALEFFSGQETKIFQVDKNSGAQSTQETQIMTQ